MKPIFLFSFILISTFSFSQTFKEKMQRKKDSLEKVMKDKATSVINGTTSPSLTNEEVIKALKEALSIGTNNSAGIASKADGYLKNPRLFIPWPAEAQEMKIKLLKMGFKKKIEDFETSLNRAAEEAAKSSASVFIDAITNMSVQDGFAILKSNDTAATNYLRKTTYTPLEGKFMPTVKEAINKVKVTSYWNPLVTAYNKMPGVKKQNPDLDKYVTNKAINGLMLLISDEEIKIRKDPVARVTDLLKKVFGAAK
ncbi:MAG: DUF4197 domain-containing protein [Bacteroidetes bacterium]|nr:DUF4197 domain-containing protein [Bacteroidota bacterium]